MMAAQAFRERHQVNGDRGDHAHGAGRSAEASSLAPLVIKLVLVVALVVLAYGLWRNLRGAPPALSSSATAPAAARPGAVPATPRAVVETPVTRWASLDNLFIQRPVIAPGDELEIVAQWRFGADAGRWIHIDCEIRSLSDPSAAPLACAMSPENRNILLLPVRTGSYQFAMTWSLDGHPSELRKLRFEVVDRSRGGALAGPAAPIANPGASARPGPTPSPSRAATTTGAGRRDRTPEEQMDDLSRR